MADIRINALPTTATSTASDDYIAIDGSANGTRKLSAYSPTFGGNLTVSGTGNNQIGGSGSKIGLGTAPNASAGTYIKNSSGYTLLVDTGRTDAGTTGIFLRDNAGSVRGWVGFDPTGTTLQISGNGGGTAIGDNLTVSGASYNNFTGALWLGTTAGYGTLNVGNVSGTGTATYSCLTIGDQSTPANATGIYMRGTSAVCGISTAGAPIAFFTGGPGTSEAARFFNNGNFGIGTGSTDGGQKLQVSGTAYVSGDATFAGYVLNRVNAKGIYTGTSDNCGFTWTGTNGEFSTASGSLILKSAGTTALTLDSSQNATFAGTVKIANTAEIKGVYTTTTTFDFGTIANNDASSSCVLTMTGVSSSDSIIVSPTDGNNFPQFCTVSAVPSGNSVSVRLYNGSGSSRTIGSRTIRVTAIKF